jgi:hypothetical protein
MGIVDDLTALAALRDDYEEFYEINGGGRRWTARPKAGGATLIEESATALRSALRVDYFTKSAEALKKEADNPGQ